MDYQITLSMIYPPNSLRTDPPDKADKVQETVLLYIVNFGITGHTESAGKHLNQGTLVSHPVCLLINDQLNLRGRNDKGNSGSIQCMEHASR